MVSVLRGGGAAVAGGGGGDGSGEGGGTTACGSCAENAGGPCQQLDMSSRHAANEVVQAVIR